MPENAQSPKNQQLCAEEIREVVLSKVSFSVIGKLMSSVNCLRETVTGQFNTCSYFVPHILLYNMFGLQYVIFRHTVSLFGRARVDGRQELAIGCTGVKANF